VFGVVLYCVVRIHVCLLYCCILYPVVFSIVLYCVVRESCGVFCQRACVENLVEYFVLEYFVIGALELWSIGALES